MKNVWILALVCAIGCNAPVHSVQLRVQQVASNAAVTVTDVHFPSPAIGGLLWYRVIVPNLSPASPLPILYLLSGTSSDPGGMQQAANAVELAASEHLIVVTPQVGDSWYTDARHRDNAQWEQAITKDLVRDVESRFPVLPGREHRGIAGLSMGGYGAFKLALKHPELYGFAGSMSGAFDVTRRWPSPLRPAQSWNYWMIFGFRLRTHQDEDVFVLLDRATNLQQVKWFASCGTGDSMYTENTNLLRRMNEHGAVIETRFTPGGHDWHTWETTMPHLFKAAGKNLQ